MPTFAQGRHPQGGETYCERAFGGLASGDAAPGSTGQGLSRGLALFARHRLLARPASTSVGPQRLGRRGRDLLGARHADRPGQARTLKPCWNGAVLPFLASASTDPNATPLYDRYRFVI